ncbi:MAG: Mur ligase family protein [Candidatus Aureabacteria bacterium]|nr:Mur ligase family protein [Candidatus Auribacterota bacterium]
MKIHMSAICGMGMGSLAQLLRESGHRVSGSDSGMYPPMSTLLERLGIEMKDGFNPEHIPSDTELVIIGNAVRRENPEVEETFRRGLSYYSFPQALEEMYLKERMSIVVAGTHGKTTTCSLITWILHHAGLDPGFLIGGVLQNFDSSSARGSGRHFVVEGDEYHSAFFDREPKFLHYRPSIGILTSVDFDHADIFSGLEECKKAFARFAALIPLKGLLIACTDNPHIREIIASVKNSTVESYGFEEGASWRLSDFRGLAEGSSFILLHGAGEKYEIFSPLAGRHNALNAAAAFIAGQAVGIPADRIRDGISRYLGVKRRQEVRGVIDDIVVIDDFAHHPTEVRETIAAIKGRYAGRRLWAVWEPRTNSSRRNYFQGQYAEAFSGADRVIIAGVYHPEQIEESRRFSSTQLSGDLRMRGVDARAIETVDEILSVLTVELRKGDVVLIMSNGAFGNIHDRLLRGIRERSPHPGAGSPAGR